MAKKINDLLKNFENVINEGDLDSAQKFADQIREELGDNHPKVTWAEETLELEKIPLGE